MKKLLSFILLVPALVFGQAEYVRIENPVYSYLERMEALNVIPTYNKFEIPKTRSEIASFISIITDNREKLDNIDNNILEDLRSEFELELRDKENISAPDTLLKTQSLIGTGEYDFLSEKEKFLFAYIRRGEANIFVNLLGESQLINHKAKDSTNKSSFVGILGGEIRGTFLGKFGFEIRGTNGNAFGDREAALQRRDLQYNFKFNEKPDETFFDETEGYLTADFNIVKFKFGRDRINIGYGSVKTLFANSSPLFDYLSLKIDYEFFNFSFFHGKLLGSSTFQPDSVTGGSTFIEEKHIAYHRIGFNVSRHLDFGVGEIALYGERAIDLSYLNPFTFYKSIEHSNRDRDNAMLFADINNNSVPGLTLYSTLLIDDISFGKIGTGWWGNQVMLNAGLYSSMLYKIIPMDIKFDYLRIEPYTLSHRLIRNNYTNYGYNLNEDIQPNSELFFGQLLYRINHRLIAALGFKYSVHGANPIDENGIVLKNVGGDISLGHRMSDTEEVFFLDGELEYKRNITFSLTFEPINLIRFSFFLENINESLQNSTHINALNTYITLDLKL